MTDRKECLVLFSGGRDSWLVASFLIEQGYRVLLTYFENGAGVGSKNILHCIERLKTAYGDCVESLGTISIAGIWREFFLPYVNMTPSEVLKSWGELPVSQFHCLTCRSAMYVWSIIKSRRSEIHCVAEGARRSQSWPIMQPRMIERFRKFFQEYSLELLLPVYDLESDWTRKNLLLMRGFIPKTLEPQCLIGVPLPDDKAPPESVLCAVENFFDTCILPRAKKLIAEQNDSVDGSRVGEEEV
ncbi:hypothetical protein KAU37_02560 [Candidatus Bipolaricaulota bacterium]|nr:hypothetical protein [Candidatus Bipolaricaulota bacterium]